MSKFLTKSVLCVDCEMTCYGDEGDPEGFRPEIIEVGVVEVDNASLSVVEARNWLVRTQSTKTPVSDFCRELTGISAADLKKNGRGFVEVRNSVVKSFGTKNKIWTSWGNDKDILDSHAQIYGTEPMFGPRFVDLSAVFGMFSNSGRRVGMYDAMRQMNVPSEGRRHSGLDDAMNLARLYIEYAKLLRKVEPNPSMDPETDLSDVGFRP